MEVCHGSNRKAYVFENYVVKIPKIHMKQFAEYIKILFIRYRRKEDIESIYNIKQDIGNLLLRGIKANYNEGFSSYGNTKKYVADTKFSLFGLLNVQEKLDITFFGIIRPLDAVLDSMQKYTGNERDYIRHTLSQGSNFGYDKNGDLKICDYGEKIITDFLELYGDEVMKNYQESMEIRRNRRNSRD